MFYFCLSHNKSSMLSEFQNVTGSVSLIPVHLLAKRWQIFKRKDKLYMVTYRLSITLIIAYSLALALKYPLRAWCQILSDRLMEMCIIRFEKLIRCAAAMSDPPRPKKRKGFSFRGTCCGIVHVVQCANNWHQLTALFLLKNDTNGWVFKKKSFSWQYEYHYTPGIHTLSMYGMSRHEEVKSDEIVELKYIKRSKLLLMLIHKHCGLWHTELWCHLWSTFCLHKGLWPYLPLESVFLPEKACMRSMLVSSAGLQTPLYKPRLGHRQALP